jgi:hypothetical protein
MAGGGGGGDGDGAEAEAGAGGCDGATATTSCDFFFDRGALSATSADDFTFAAV